MGYDDLESQEREQVISAARVAGLLLLHSEGKSSVISMSCLKKSPSHQDPVQPCHHCSKVLGLSGFRNTLRSKKSKLDRYSPFLSIDAQMIRAGEDQKAANVNKSRGLLGQTFADNTPLGESLVSTHYRRPIATLGVR